MTFKISGFGNYDAEKEPAQSVREKAEAPAAARRAVVQVRFPGKGMALSYYNDQFDLKVGDLVYVDGKLEGKLGRVVDINYNFKIKISEYKKVIAVCSTNVSGQFFMAGSHFVSFDPDALPAEQATMWFRAPEKEDDEYESGTDDTAFLLDDLKTMNIAPAVAERGHGYYMENRVRYISLNGSRGYAVVEGSQGYVVEFAYNGGQISELICDCFCSGACKHEFAAMLQLRETLEMIEKNYPEEYARTGYFAAVNKGTLFAFSIDGKETGSFSL